MESKTVQVYDYDPNFVENGLESFLFCLYAFIWLWFRACASIDIFIIGEGHFTERTYGANAASGTSS